MCQNQAPAPTESEQLLHALKNHKPRYVDDLRENIAVLNSDDPGFSTVANQLINNGAIDPKWMALWVYSSGKTHNALREAKRKSSDYGIDYTATNLILEEAIMLTTLHRLGYGYEDGTIWFTQAGHELLLKEAYDLLPHLLASNDTVDRYYCALTTATSIVNPRKQWQQFLEEAPVFMAWSKDHADITLILEAATRAQSLNRTNVEAFMPMVSSTHSAVQGGLL